MMKMLLTMKWRSAAPIKTVMRTTVVHFFLLSLCASASFANGKEYDSKEFNADDIIVKGVVTSEKGEPLPGVSIFVKGTSSGATTDTEGKYVINVPASGILVFTYIGYTDQEIAVGNQTVINVVLAESNVYLNEVVVVGYGTQEKKDITGSVASVEGKDLKVAPTPDLLNNLAGKLPGVIVTQGTGQPGYDDPEFSIRGKSTFGNNSALVLVDGIERPFSRIDPNDIESVTILKDAASAAVYGARAANGVVLITTKQAKSGTTQISYSGSFGLQTPTFRPEMMNSYEYAKYFNEARFNSGNTPFYTDEEVEKFRLGNDPAYPNTDWWKESVHNSAPIQQNNLTIQSGTDKMKFIFSLGNLNQKGLYDLSSFTRKNVRSNINYKIDDNLTLVVDVNGRIEGRNQSANDFGAWRYMFNSLPTYPAYVSDPEQPGKQALGFNGLNGNPIGKFSNSGYDKNTSTYFMTTGELEYQLPWVEGLSARARFAYDKSFYHSKTFVTPFTYYNYDRVNNTYTAYESASFPTLDEYRGEGTQSTFQLYMNYDRKFGVHSISGLLLYEQIEDSNSDLYGYREDFLSSSIDQMFGGSNVNKDNGGSASESARQGYVGRVNYNYADKYLLQANFRYDGSYNFSPEKRWGFFPAVSGAWRISEEPFMKNISFLSNLKLRSSYGQFGNDRISPFQYLTGYVISQGYITDGTYHSGIRETGLSNPNVTWETATNRDVGLELGFFDGKLESEVTSFYKRTKDILLPRSGSVPSTFGAILPDENIGVVDNRGLEFMIRHNNRIGQISYSIEANVTHAKSEVIFMDEPANVEDRIRKTGRPFDQYFGLVSEGFFQSQQEIDNWADQDGQANASLAPGDIKYLDINSDGKIDGFDVKQIGKSGTPETVFGLNLRAEYKGLGFVANFQGATAFNRKLQLDPFAINSNALRVNIDAWRPDNTDAAYPRLTTGLTSNNNQFSSQWLVDNTYLRLRNAQIYYSLPGTMVKKLGVQMVQIFVSGNNILTWSKRDFVDPELLSVGADPIYYPHLKSYNLGLNVNF